jgi:hypothetical protein
MRPAEILLVFLVFYFSARYDRRRPANLRYRWIALANVAAALVPGWMGLV